jgi:dTDP-glucose pyrophosphorylase
VTRVIEKPRHAPNKLKGVGLYLFDPAIFDAIRRTPRTALRDEYELTDAIQVLIDDGYPVYPSSVIGLDINLTAPADLLRANLCHAQLATSETAIAADVRMHPDARVRNSVLGANVEVASPIEIMNSVVFAGTRVESHATLDRAIITPLGLVDCRPLLDLSQTPGSQLPC